MIKLPHDVLGDLHIPYGQVYCFQNIHAFLCGISDIQADIQCCRNPREELGNYIRLGGFPATHLQEYSQDEVYTIVRDIYNSTIFSDIVKRN